jgi:hypothetical protein
MQIIIHLIPCFSLGFRYFTSHNTSGNSIAYSLVQHLSEIYGDIASISNSGGLLSSSDTPSTTMPPAHLYNRCSIAFIDIPNFEKVESVSAYLMISIYVYQCKS